MDDISGSSFIIIFSFALAVKKICRTYINIPPSDPCPNNNELPTKLNRRNERKQKIWIESNRIKENNENKYRTTRTHIRSVNVLSSHSYWPFSLVVTRPNCDAMCTQRCCKNICHSFDERMKRREHSGRAPKIEWILPSIRPCVCIKLHRRCHSDFGHAMWCHWLEIANSGNCTARLQFIHANETRQI